MAWQSLGETGMTWELAQSRPCCGSGVKGTETEGAVGSRFVGTVFRRAALPTAQVTVLVMCHTRELAFQISKEYERFCKYMPSVKVSPLPHGAGGLPGQLPGQGEPACVPRCLCSSGACPSRRTRRC